MHLCDLEAYSEKFITLCVCEFEISAFTRVRNEFVLLKRTYYYSKYMILTNTKLFLSS